MTDDKIQTWKDRIDTMTHMEMAAVHRYAPAGHPCFDLKLPLHEYFRARFESLGGMTPEVSKAIG